MYLYLSLFYIFSLLCYTAYTTYTTHITVEKLEADVLSLDPIYRRISDHCNKKQRQERRGHNSDPSHSTPSNYNPTTNNTQYNTNYNSSNSNNNSSSRAKYQDLLKTQQKAVVMLNEYIGTYEQKKAKQVCIYM